MRRDLLLLFYPKPLTGTWPRGSNGPLNVGAGQTVNLVAGGTHDYSSILNLGTINIVGNGVGHVTIIGCAGNFNNQGTIKGVDNGDWSTTQIYSATAPDGTVVSYSPVSNAGGAGGENGDADTPAINSAFGQGTGGTTVAGAGTSPSNTISGGGGNSLYALGGAGVANWGITGNNGQDTPNPADNCSGGGGGGTRGLNGQIVYFNVAGNILNAGTINFSGAAGGGGGGGGNSTATLDATGAGGGGGGAGGYGGLVKFRVHGSGSASLAAAINVSGGTFGGPGNGGFGGNVAGEEGQQGGFGVSGAAGVKSISTY